jgi:hypothetical protein
MAKKPKTDKISGSADQSNESLNIGTGAAEGNSTEAGEKTPKAPKTRGPRGVSEDAVITLVATVNPKRVGSKAHAAFANYVNGMTVKAFADAVGAEATGHLVYDAKHGFITIAGYDPGAIIVAKPKVAKEPKAKKEAAAEVDPTAAAEAMEAQTEAGAEEMA